MESLYDNNGAYDDVARVADLEGNWLEAIKPLRSSVNRSVEFYVNHILAGAKITSDKPNVLTAIEQFNKWSNFEGNKRSMTRNLSIYGDLFIKVLVNDKMDKVYREEISAKNVTSFKLNKMGIIKEIRIDLPIENGMTYTEYWTDEGEGYVSIWEHPFGKSAELDRLGTPKEFLFLAEMGIDFVPVVYVPFIDARKRGQGCVSHALDKIDEANRMATRLHQLLFRFNKPYLAVMANSIDAQGRPIPAPRIATKESTNNSKKTDNVVVGDDSIFYLPGMSKMESVIPDINYGDALNILNAMMHEIELDLPELKSYSLDATQLSGKAISLILGSAISRAKDARDNLIQGLERVNEMALTIGKFYGIFPEIIGSYEAGDFEHEIVCDEIYGMDATDKAVLIKAYTDAGLPLTSAMRLAGYNQEEIDKVIEEKTNQDVAQNTNLANSLLAFNRG